MTKKHLIFNAILILFSLVLCMSSVIHKSQINNIYYSTSYLITIEFICIIVLIFIHILNFILFFIHIFKRNKKLALFSFLSGLISILLFFFSFFIDMETLIYMT
jgi:hypothetical protein